MTKSIIEKIVGKDSITVVEAMQLIDKNVSGIVILVDEKGLLTGTLTDGDIRRFLLSGGKLDDRALYAANKNPKFSSSFEQAEQLYHKKDYVAIPIVDETNRVVDVYVGEKKKRGYPKLNIPVVINAGGKGTRLDPFTRVLPKPLIPVGDLPIIEHIMEYFSKYGCTEFHIIVNYKRELMKAYFSENENHYDITWYDEEIPLGTGGGLSLLKEKINKTFFFTNCDTLIQTNYESMLNFHKDNNNVITMICAHKNITIPYGVIDMGENGIINSFKEKPLMSFLTNTGMYLVEPEVLDIIDNNIAIGFPDIVEKVRQGEDNVAVYPISESEWMDMGQLSELEKMRKRLYGE